jgi:hypothetical protein
MRKLIPIPSAATVNPVYLMAAAINTRLGRLLATLKIFYNKISMLLK